MPWRGGFGATPHLWGGTSPPPPPSALTLVNVRTAQSTSAATTYTFSAVDIGAAAENRIVRGVVGWWSNTQTRTLNSVTVGGVTATLNAQQSGNTGGDATGVHVFSAAVPSGTTADIVVTFSAGIGQCGIVVGETYGGVVTAADTVETSAAAATVSGNIDVAAGGLILAGAHGVEAESSEVSGTGLDEIAQLGLNFISIIYGGKHESAGGETGRAIEVTFAEPDTSYNTRLVAASFSP